MCHAFLCVCAGDINTINGIPYPEMPLEPKWYRFRLLNAAVSRPYQVKIKDEFGKDVHHLICKIFGADGGYRSEAIPFPPEGLQISNAERYDVACNFQRYRGRRLYLW
jgi:FtsP/CotA-like multicopper oxidase with cupredoxin domain